MADLSDDRCVLMVNRECWLDALRTINEEPHGLVLNELLRWRRGLAPRQFQRGYRVLSLRAQSERRPAGGQHLESGYGAEELPDEGCCLDEVLDIVQDQEQLLV